MAKYDIFVSYSRKDYEIIDKFITALEDAGYKIWFDREGIESSEDFKHVIVSAIEESSVFLFFSSARSNQSSWTAKEIGIANSRHKPIIPIKLDYSNYNKSVEFDLINIDFIDYADETKKQENLQKLNYCLQSIIGDSNKDLFNLLKFSFTPRPVKNKQINKRSLFIVAAILGVILIFSRSLFITFALVLLIAYLWRHRGRKSAILTFIGGIAIVSIVSFIVFIDNSESSNNISTQIDEVTEEPLTVEEELEEDTKSSSYTKASLIEANNYLYDNLTGTLSMDSMMKNEFLKDLYNALCEYDDNKIYQLIDSNYDLFASEVLSELYNVASDIRRLKYKKRSIEPTVKFGEDINFSQYKKSLDDAVRTTY